jgi:DNA-binding transcriptional LysR family regulator
VWNEAVDCQPAAATSSAEDDPREWALFVHCTTSVTLTQLEHVVATHRAGSFSRAARACGITQAALSNSIAKLEEELGERVFARTTRRITLTPFGEKLLPHVMRALDGRDAIVEAAKAQHAPTTTVLGHSPLIPSPILTQILGAIRDARFGTEIRLVEENLSDLLQRLAEHTIDIAVLPDAEYASVFRSAAVFEEPLYYVPRRSLHATAPAELKELGGDTFVMVPDRCGLARLTRALFAEANLPLNTYAGEAMGYHVLQEWAALDLGSAILPASRVAKDVRAVPLLRAPDVPATVTYRAVWHREYRRGKELAALLRPSRPQ